MDYDTINEQWEEIILEKASAALTDAAYKKFGKPQDAYDDAIMERWMDIKIASGWIDRKMEKLWAMIPEGPQA